MTAVSVLVASAPAVASAETPRQLLTTAAFETTGKARALTLVGQAIAASDKILAAHPGDRDAMLQRGVAIGYRAKLSRSRGDAKASRTIFEGLAAKNPRDAEAQMAVAGWHLDAVDQLGSFMARTALGAKTQTGEVALNRAVALGGNRPFYKGLGAMMVIRQDPASVAQARKWAEAAAVAPASTPLDTHMKRAAAAMLPALKANDGKRAAGIARRMLPFGKLPG